MKSLTIVFALLAICLLQETSAMWSRSKLWSRNRMNSEVGRNYGTYDIDDENILLCVLDNEYTCNGA